MLRRHGRIGGPIQKPPVNRGKRKKVFITETIVPSESIDLVIINNIEEEGIKEEIEEKKEISIIDELEPIQSGAALFPDIKSIKEKSNLKYKKKKYTKKKK